LVFSYLNIIIELIIGQSSRRCRRVRNPRRCNRLDGCKWSSRRQICRRTGGGSTGTGDTTGDFSQEFQDTTADALKDLGPSRGSKDLCICVDPIHSLVEDTINALGEGHVGGQSCLCFWNFKEYKHCVCEDPIRPVLANIAAHFDFDHGGEDCECFQG